jgi:DNA repair exonuclease SbcCD ATPase subunit
VITFNYIHLVNHLFFKDLHWQLDKYPLSVIRATNLDQKIATSNGVGKSVLGSAPAALLVDAPLMAVKKKSSKDLVQGKARIEFGVTNDKDKWKIVQYAKAKSVKYDIYLNDEPQEIKDIAPARALINKAVPLSEDHIYSQIYISSYRPSVLLYGKSSARLNYFEQIFDLRIYDQLRQAVIKDLKTVNLDYVQANVLAEQKNLLSSADHKNVKKRLDKIKARHKTILEQYTLSHKNAQNLTRYVALAEQLFTPDGTLEELQELLAKFKKDAIVKQAKVELHQEYKAAIKADEKNRARRQAIEAELADLVYEKDAEKEITQLNKKIQSLSDTIKQYEKYREQIERYHHLLHKYTDPDKNTSAPDALQENLSKLRFELQQKRQLKSDKPCPLCAQLVPHSHKNQMQQLKKQISKTEKRLVAAKDLDFIKRAQAKLSSKLLNFDLNAGHQSLEKYRKKLLQVFKHRHTNARIDYLKQQLKHIPRFKKPKTVDKKDWLDDAIEENLGKVQRAIYRIEADIKIKRQLAKLPNQPLSLRDAKKTLLKEQSVVANMTPKLQSVADLMQSLTQEQADYKSTKSRLKAIEQQLADLNESISQRTILEALSKAYSNKGIRLLQVQDLASTYIKTLNRLASNIYSMPIVFSAKVGDNTFDILAERNGKIGDIRSLSGAESRQFLALSALALCSLMPLHLRCSTIIFDEIEAGMAIPARKKFVTDFLPLVMNVVPNVVIITPYTQQEFFIPEAKELMLVRKDKITYWG